MILEVAMLNVRSPMESEFEVAFTKASAIIASMRGYISHELHRCIEVPNRYLLLVRWQTVEDHTTGFRSSPEYDQWKQLLHHFYDPFPTVEHFEEVLQYQDNPTQNAEPRVKNLQ
jgi:heme-degrading monooxygenase HmoA